MEKNSTGKSFQSIQSKVFKMIIFRVLCPTFVFLILLFSIIMKQTIRKTMDSLDYQNDITLMGMENYLSSMEDLTNYVVLDSEIQKDLSLDYTAYPGKETLMQYQSNQRITGRLTNLLHLNSTISSAFLVPQNMDIFYQVDGTTVPIVMVEDYPFYQNILNNSGKITTQVVPDNPLLFSHPDTLVVGRSIIDPLQGNRLKGVFFFNVSLDQLKKFCEPTALDRESRNYIYWQDTVFGKEDMGEEDSLRLREFMDSHGNSSYAYSTIRRVGGRFCFLRFSASDRYGIRIINVIPLPEMIRLSGAYVIAILLFAIMITVLMLLVTRLSVHDITVPIITLQQAMTRAEDNDDYSAIDFEISNDEIGMLARTYNHLAEHIKNLIERIKAEEKEKAGIELLALQSQINPHFIYNTLESIKVMARLQGAVPVAGMIERFTVFLRYCARGERNLVTLKEELEIADHFMAIMNFRYMDAFTYICSVPERLYPCVVPKFIMQPILENCIRHGFAGDEKPDKRVEVTAAEADGVLTIRIMDNGVGMEAEEMERIMTDPDASHHSTQIGISNINRRIHLLYKGDYGLFMESVPGEYTTVSYRLPCTIGGGEEQ